MSFKVGDQVRVVDGYRETKDSGWPSGCVGELIGFRTAQALLRFPGATEGHDGKPHMPSLDLNKEHWWVDLDSIFPAKLPPDPAVTEMVNDYVQDVQGR